jgi:hypothetical protein
MQTLILSVLQFTIYSTNVWILINIYVLVDGEDVLYLISVLIIGLINSPNKDPVTT